MSMAIHSRWMGVGVEGIHATGGTSANVQILQVIADVFGADVSRLDQSNSAALGAALRAAHADLSAANPQVGWRDVIAGFTEPAGAPVRPRQDAIAVYREVMPRYAAFEARSLTP